MATKTGLEKPKPNYYKQEIRYQVNEKADNNTLHLVDINIWKHHLYDLQQKAPTPKRVLCHREVAHRPRHYGREFHGILSREEAEHMLSEEGTDGRYLIRESLRNRGQMTLSLRFNNATKNYRLFYDGQHFVGDKKFDTIHDLVADGLITLYLELHASEYIANLSNSCKYEESPYMTLYKNKKVINKSKHRSVIHNNKSSNLMQIKRLSNYEDKDFDDNFMDDGIDVQQFEKKHNFKTHNFMGSPWCDFCGNFIWGVIGQGVKCEDCGFGSHRKCSEKVPNDCSPDLRHIRRIFGVDLTAFVKASNNVRPFVVDLCIKEIEKRGLNNEGLYRVSGSADEIEILKCRFETDWEQTELYFSCFEDIHVITGVLKLYFRSLPIPLITFDAYPRFIAAINKPNLEQRLNAMKESVNGLPPANYQTLRFFIIHLYKVTTYESKNLMSAKNLGLIFGQTLLHTPNIPMLFQVNCWQNESDVIETLILYHSRLFNK
ncbi:N-chimaerin-like [Oppia nitens]|uniref:N-chimaerin-like n=1 Tax=Oppia nitens TaxID=1686743 RepID=UPI0023DBA18F|nr:N-chimaerin-like [Oppia nitens]